MSNQSSECCEALSAQMTSKLVESRIGRVEAVTSAASELGLGLRLGLAGRHREAGSSNFMLSLDYFLKHINVWQRASQGDTTLSYKHTLSVYREFDRICGWRSIYTVNESCACPTTQSLEVAKHATDGRLGHPPTANKLVYNSTTVLLIQQKQTNW